ncbi:MAG: LysR substrate-binding domain-containing protein [Myxococcota bacterium]
MNYGEVDLNLLVVLERVLARQSVADAAGDLGLSPSATSRALQRLRDAIGDPLMVRAGNTLIPTERARELVAPTARALEAAREVFFSEADVDIASATGALVLALGAELQQALLPAIVQRFQAVAPGVALRVRELSDQSAEQGRRGLLHLAIAPDLKPILPADRWPDLADFVHTPLYTRRFVVIGAPGGWPAAPDLDAYTDAGHVIMSTEGGSRGFMDDLLQRVGRTRRVVCSVSTFGAVTQVVRSTRLLALIPAEIVGRLAADLACFPPPTPVPTMTMGMLWHPRYTTQPRHRALRRLIADVVRAQVDRAV